MMHSERPLSFKRASVRQTLYPYPDSPALGEQDRRSMSTTGGALPRQPYRSGLFSLYPQKTGEQLSKPKNDEGSDDERDPAQIEAAYLNLVGGGGNRNMSSELSFGLSGAAEAMDGYAISPADEARKRSQYFDEQFQYKDARLSSVRERIEKDSPVVAELRTNVIVKDEFTLVTDISYHLSQRYSRPESSIMINVEHSACLLLAGSFEPAYILTITALPSQLQPVTNKRNSALIQSFMAEVLSVPPERGIVRYQPISEENLATNGTTVLGEIERFRKTSTEPVEGMSAASAIKRAWTKSGRRSVHAKKPSLKNVDEPPTETPDQPTHAPTTGHSRQPSQVYSQSAISLTSHPGPAYNNYTATPPVQEVPSPTQGVEKDTINDATTATNNTTTTTTATTNTNDTPTYTTSTNTEDKRKSQLNGILKNATNTTSPRHSSPRPVTVNLTPMKAPPVPADVTPSPKMAKRKSFISIFKR